jgi:MFS transporter, PPP family, 3-phenylpropionic acid transporter
MASTLPALTDVLVLKRAREDGFNYGWPRGIGSAAFIVGNIVVGWLLTRGSPDVVLVWIVAAAALASVSARFLLPPDAVHDDHPQGVRERLAGLGELVKDRAFMLAVVSAGLIQSAHAFYYSFSTLTWKQQGIPESLTGVLWGTAVAVEIAFLWFMEPWRRALGPMRLLLLGGAAAVVRWTALAFSPPLAILFPLQALHTLSYAATFIASLELVQRYATARNASAAQALNSALSGGVLAGLATMASGWLFDRVGAHGYLLMSAMSLLGLMGAVRLASLERR